MTYQALLEAIEAAGQDALAELERETAGQIEAVLAEAAETAGIRRKAAYEDALRPAGAERARRLHEARMEALKITAAARDELAERLRVQVEAQLGTLRDQPQYPAIFRRLVEEAVTMLGEQEMATCENGPAGPPRLEVDGRDEALALELLQELPRKVGIEMIVAPEITTWGGAAARSGDGRITVTNTLEARLNQLAPRLGTFIA